METNTEAGRRGDAWNKSGKMLNFPGGSVVKNPPANTEDMGSIPGLGSSTGEGNGNPLQYSYQGNPMDRKAWQPTVPTWSQKSQTPVSD